MNTQKFLVGVLVLILIIVAFILGRSGVVTPFNSVSDNATKQTSGGTANKSKATDTTSNTANTAGIPSLPQGQLDMLKSFGIDPTKVVITTSMMACAEGKVGTARFTEIKNGATPTMFEGAKLVACYK